MLCLLIACNSPKTDHAQNNTENTIDMQQPSIHELSFTNMEGQTISFNEFKGKKILIVNTASACGYTPQYEQLEELYQTYKDKLVVIGFPCNDFGGQEAGSNEEIQSFCKKNYGVTFPLSEKINILSEPVSPIYEWLTLKEKNGVLDATVKWNFNKFLLDEEGHLLGYFESKVLPTDKAIVQHLQ